MKKVFYLIFSLCLLLTGCSDTTDSTSKNESQGAHLLSVNVKIIEKNEDDNVAYRVQALESCGNDIENGDDILVTAEIPEIYDILDAYQESNCFRIYFPIANKTADCIGVVCYDIVQYDSSGQIIRCLEMK